VKDSYARIYERGAWIRKGNFFQQALTSRQLKVKPKSANIAGLQLADLLSNPLRKAVLIDNSRMDTPLPPFATRILKAVEKKLNRHLYTGRVKGYGKVLFPK
jgi:hypothetical protein